MGSANFELILNMIFGIVGGLGIFLLGMKNMSEGMQAIAGSKLRKMIAAVTDNRFMACGVGTTVTCIVQSSSVTTVLVVGFVSAGLMTLGQAIGVIMGANIGTTITGWILTLAIGKYGLPILGVSALVFLFSKNERIRFIGMAVMGIGMVFFGLEMMSSGFKPMRAMPEFVEWFSRFNADTYLGMWKCVFVGCILTCIVQSSSATLGITMGLAINGMIGYHTAAALVLGENIGTTITAFLASLGRPADAKRAAYFHIIFNVIGVLWITTIFQPYVALVAKVLGNDPGAMVLVDGVETFPQIRQGIAFVHSGFNIVNTMLFLPFTGYLAKIVTWLVSEDEKKEVPHLTYLDIRMLDAGAIGLQESHDEIVRMGEHVTSMFDWLKQILTSTDLDDDIVQRLFHREEVLDTVQKETTEFLGHLLAGHVTTEVVSETRMQLRIVDEYESVGDYITSLLKMHLKKLKNGIKFAPEGEKEMKVLHDVVENYVNMISLAVKESRPEILTKARAQGESITHDVKEMRAAHLERMAAQKVSPLASLIFTDMLNAYRRVKDHAFNIAEAVAGEK